MSLLFIVLAAIAAIVVLVVLGSVLVGLAFMLLWWALIGLFIGGLARLAVPGRQAIGWLETAAIGIAASLLGGVVARAADLAGGWQFVIAIGAAVLFVLGLSRGRTHPGPMSRF